MRRKRLLQCRKGEELAETTSAQGLAGSLI